MLFQNISEVKQFIGGGANLSVELASVEPVMLMAAQRHIIPYLGEEQWDDLVEAVGGPAGTEQAELMPYVQRPLALLSFYEYAQIAGIQFSEAGLFRAETDTMKSAYKYQENQYKDWMLHNGYEALELMLKFLFKNRTSYNLWDGTAAFRRCYPNLVNYASELRDLYAKYLSRYTFEVIRPVITDVEAFAISPLLGEDQYARLLEGIQADDLTSDESSLLQLCQRAVANFAIQEGSARTWIRIEGAQVIQSERLDPQGYDKTSPPIAGALSFSLRKEELTANRYISQIRTYLDNNLETFPLYAAYQEELAAAEEAAAEEANLGYDPDDPVWDRWPQSRCCSSWPHCNHSTETPKGIVRF